MNKSHQMKLLLVEDDENKKLQLTETIRKLHSDWTIKHAGSLISGVRKALQSKPDLILLDMTLPNYDLVDGDTGGGMHAFGGLEFLRQMRRSGLQVPVIVVTQFETFGHPPDLKGLPELDLEMSRHFRPEYLGLVYYHASREDWVGQLERLLQTATRGSSDET